MHHNAPVMGCRLLRLDDQTQANNRAAQQTNAPDIFHRFYPSSGFAS